MENYTNPKSAQVINVKGEIHTDVAVDTLLQVGDVVKAGAVLNLIKGSEILLAYADGSQHKVYSYEAESVNEIRVDIISPDNNTESVDSEDINNIQNEISAIQDLIDADIDAELPETTAGLTSNEGTSFATVNRTGDETLAQAGYDTTEQNNIFVLPGDLDNENNNDNFALFDADENVTVAEDTSATGNVLDNGASAGGPLSVINFSIDGNTFDAGETINLVEGEFTLNADGSYTFIPADNFNGTVPVVNYTVTDGAGNTDSSTLTILVTPVSDLTDADESVTTAEDTSVSGNVLNNAETADGPLTITSFTVDGNTFNPGDTVTLAEGELTLNPDGSYTFIPNDNFNGSVPVVSYTVTDGAGDTDSSTLTISVTPLPDLTDDNESVTTAEDTPVSGNVLDNAATADGPLTVTSFTVNGNTFNAGDTVSLTEGELTLNADGSYTFTPNDNFNGAVPVVSYTVTDGAGDTDSSTLTISVTPVSDLTDDNESVTTAEDTPVSGNVLDNAATADGPLTVTSFTVDGNTYNAGDTVTLAEGELTLNADGSYTFTPNDNFNGAVPVVSYTVTDGAGDTDSSTLAISVTPVSDLIDDNESVTTAEDTPVSGNVLDNAATADGPLTVTSFTVNGNTFNAGDTVTLTEGELTLNADGSYTFIPNDNFNGSVPVVSYTFTDGAGDTDNSTLTISVTPLSDLTDDNESVTTAEDTAVSGNVLDNAATADGPLTVTSFTVDGNTYNAGDTVTLAEGELTLNADGSYTFTPNDNFNGAVPVVSYIVTDGAGDTDSSTLTISVTPVSDLIDDNESVTTAEDTAVSGNVLDNAATADGPLTVTSFNVDGNTYNTGDTVTLTEGELTLNTDGSYTFTPNDNFNGAVPVITYTVTDGAGDTESSTLTISVTPVSDLNDDNESVTTAEDTPVSGNVLNNADSVDGPLTVTSFTVDGDTYNAGETVSLAEGELTLNTDGSYTFTPNDNFNGAVPVISYTVIDGAGDTEVSTLTISVTPVSDLSDDSETVTIAEDTTATGNVLDNAETADGPLTVTSFTVGGNTYNAGDTVTLTEGELTLNADGSYTFTPNDNFNGSVPVITYTVTDGAGDTQSSTLTISVTPVSDLSDDSETVTIAEDTTATGNVLDNAETADGPLTVTSFTVDGNTYNAGDTVTLAEGELTLNADGSYTFTPNDNFNGSVPVVSYTVTDGAGDTQSSSLTILVTPVSDLNDDNESVTTAEDTGVSGNVLNNADSLDGPLTVTSFTVDGNTYNAGETVSLAEGELTLNTDGSYTFTPNDNFNGAVPVISYTVIDGAGDTEISTLTISVTPISDLSDDSETVTIAEDTIATGNVLDNAETADGPLTVTSFTVEGNTYNAGDTVTLTEGELTLNTDGSYTFTPNDNFNGAVPVITYTVTDGAGDTQSSTLTISVTPVSDLSDDNETVTVAEDTTATGNVLDNAETADGPLTVTSFTVGGNTYNAGDTVTLTEGELTLNTDGSYTFTPNDNFNGAVPVITYTVTDGAGDTQSSTLTISVTPVSDLNDDSETVTIAEDTTATGNVLDNAETADGPLTVTSFTVGGNTYNAGDTVTLTEGELTLNTDGSYTFTPNDDFNGAVPVITYTVTDGAGDTESSTLTISVTPVSDLSDDN
ncbi:tandem-95 repeat protein, partial [Colwellia sp. BRX8-2]